MKKWLKNLPVYVRYYNLEAGTDPLSVAVVVCLIIISAALVSSIFIPDQLMVIFGNDLGCNYSFARAGCSPLFLEKFLLLVLLVGITLGTVAGLITKLIQKKKSKIQ